MKENSKEKTSTDKYERHTEKELHSRDVPTDDDSVDEDDKDDYGDLNDDGDWQANPKRCFSYFGIVMSVTAGFFMACTSLMVKLAQSLPFYEHLAIQGFGTLSFCLPILIYLFQPIIPTTKRETGLVYGRGIFVCGAFHGLFHLLMQQPSSFSTPCGQPFWPISSCGKSGANMIHWPLLSVAGVVLVARPSFLFPTQQSVISSTDTGKVLAYAISFAGSIAAALSFIFVRKSNAATPILVPFWSRLCCFWPFEWNSFGRTEVPRLWNSR